MSNTNKSIQSKSKESELSETISIFKKKVELVQSSWALFEKLGLENCGEIIFQNVFGLMPAIISFFPFKNELNIYKSFSFKNHAL